MLVSSKKKDILELFTLIAAILLVGYISSFKYFRFDLTSEKRYTLSQSTKEVLRTLDVYIKVYLDGDLPLGLKRMRRAIKETLDEFRVYGGKKLHYEFINPNASPSKEKREAMLKHLYEMGLEPTNVQERNPKGGTTQRVIFPGAVVGAIPQDLKFKGEESLVIVGDNTTIRECVTINRGTAAKGKTVVGSNCLLMAYCHVAHDCIVGDNVILGNATQLAGEVEVDDWAILSGGSLVHQFTRIGKHTMIQGGSRVTKDVPPYVTAGREPLQYAGVNSIGLRRRGFTNSQIREIQDVYRFLFQSRMNTTHALESIQQELPATDERDEILLFVKDSPRGIIKSYFD